MAREDLTILEIQNLMMDTLNYTGDDLNPVGNNFYKYDYQGTQNNLFNLMEALAIKKGLLNENIKLKRVAWGAVGDALVPKATTNFNKVEIKKIYEAFHILLNRGIIAPGAVGNYGSNLPYFHVTEYGVKCLKATYILPYDSERYLDKLDEINNLNVWVRFYIEQALECFNSYCYEAALIMVGLANETIIEELLTGYIKYLAKSNPTMGNVFKQQIEHVWNISSKYSKYLESLRKSMDKDKRLRSLSRTVDKLANETFMSYIRLARNELSHPNQIRVNRITALMILVSFVNYCKRQYTFINYFRGCASYS